MIAVALIAATMKGLDAQERRQRHREGRQ
jgi:hypothetical protein